MLFPREGTSLLAAGTTTAMSFGINHEILARIGMPLGAMGDPPFPATLSVGLLRFIPSSGFLPANAAVAPFAILHQVVT